MIYDLWVCVWHADDAGADLFNYKSIKICVHPLNLCFLRAFPQFDTSTRFPCSLVSFVCQYLIRTIERRWLIVLIQFYIRFKPILSRCISYFCRERNGDINRIGKTLWRWDERSFYGCWRCSPFMRRASGRWRWRSAGNWRSRTIRSYVSRRRKSAWRITRKRPLSRPQSSFDFGGTPISSLKLVEKVFTLSVYPQFGQMKISFPGTTMDMARKIMATTSQLDAPQKIIHPRNPIQAILARSTSRQKIYGIIYW